MSAPTAALAWEMWRRGRRSAWLSIGCVAFCAFLNLVLLDRLHIPPAAQNVFPTVFGLLMTLSFLLLMGVFNYTDTVPTKDWNGFPYRLFVLPVPTWRLVALPVTFGVVAVELVYVAWIKLVWTHEPIPMPEWFAVILGAYMVFYQTALWTLARFRVIRLVALGLGGVSSIATACLPLLAQFIPLPWLTKSRLIVILLVLAVFAFVIAWATVARQRSGGGHRRSWIRNLIVLIVDALPTRTKDFSSPATAQFWFEWRRAGWVLPACTVVVLAIIAPISWFYRHDAGYAGYILGRLLAMPFVLAFVIGKGFIKCDFWTSNLAMAPFLAVRPLRAGDFVVTKMKVAAVSVVIAWLAILVFVALWLPLWANTSSLKPLIWQFRMFFPRSWVAIAALLLFGCTILTWRCVVSGLWTGLSGNPLYYYGSMAIQILVPILFLIAAGIWSDTIDRTIRTHPDLVKFGTIRAISWSFAFLVIVKFWLAAFSWNKITPRRTREYLLVWSGVTICLVVLAILARPPFDVYRQGYIYPLVALWLFPFARLGIAPLSLAKNRHRS